MKKNILTTILLFIAFALSSCLGDSSSTAESGDSVCYIKRFPGSTNTVAVSPGFGLVTSTEIQNPSLFQVGRFYEMSFKYDNVLGTTGNAYNVTDVKFTNVYQEPIPAPEYDRGVPSFYDVESMPEDANEVYLNQLALYTYQPIGENFDDKYVFMYQCKLDENDIAGASDYGGRVELVAYLDRSNQKQGSSSSEAVTPALEDNQIRVNLRLRRTSGGEPNLTPKEKSYTGMGIVDLSEIRREFEQVRGVKPEGSEDYALAYIQFQFEAQSLSDKDKITTSTIGSLTEGARDVITMAILKDE